jgi:hypothetical protein
MSALFIAIGLSSMACPLIWELYNDRNGDDSYVNVFGHLTIKNKAKDVYVRIGIAVASAFLNKWLNDASLIASFFVSLSFHFLVFDYAIAYILGHREWSWFSYLGKKSVIDNLDVWHSMAPLNRFVTRLEAFVISGLFYWQTL